MANIKLNGQTSIENMTCFSYAPTIFEVSSTNGGSCTIFQLTFGEFSGLDYSTKYTFQVNDTVLTMVSTPQEAKGYRFYMAQAYTATQRKQMVNSLLEAMKRIPEVVAGYNISMPSSGGEKQTSIILVSKGYGNNTPLTIKTNIPFINITSQTGTASTELKEGSLNIDVYKVQTPYKYNGNNTDIGNFLTTLSKHTANDAKVKFDLGSVFASYTEEGEVAQFRLMTYIVTDNGLSEVNEFNNIYNVN